MAAKKELEEMTIRKAENGGHTVRHEFKRQPAHKGGLNGGMYSDRPPSEEHVFGPDDDAKLAAHVSKHLDLKGISTKGEFNADDEPGNQE